MNMKWNSSFNKEKWNWGNFHVKIFITISTSCVDENRITYLTSVANNILVYSLLPSFSLHLIKKKKNKKRPSVFIWILWLRKAVERISQNVLRITKITNRRHSVIQKSLWFNKKLFLRKNIPSHLQVNTIYGGKDIVE